MALDTKIKGAGTGLTADVISDGINGLAVYTEQRRRARVRLTARNKRNATNLAINGAAASSELINNGGDTSAWTATATGNVVLSSTTQAFDGTRSVEWPSGGPNSEAQFKRPSGTVQTTNQTVITGAIYLAAAVSGSDVEMILRLAGANVSPWSSLAASIDFGNVGAWQSFNTSTSIFGAAGIIFDEIWVRKRGSGTTMFIDVLKFESLGDVDTLFNLQPVNPIFNSYPILIDKLSLYIETPLDSTLSNAALQNISPVKFGNRSALSVGINFNVIQSDISFDSFNIANNRDILTVFAPDVDAGGDNSDSWLRFRLLLPTAILIIPDGGNRIEFRVQDDLTLFTRVEINGVGVIDTKFL